MTERRLFDVIKLSFVLKRFSLCAPEKEVNELMEELFETVRNNLYIL